MSREKLQGILLDIHVAEVLVSLKDTNDKKYLQAIKDTVLLRTYYASVFQHHQVTFDDFYTTYMHYLYDKPEELDSIYVYMQDTLEGLRKSLDMPLPEALELEVPEGAERLPLAADATDTAPLVLPADADSNNDKKNTNSLRPERLNE